jgi:hypothetical protein
MRHAWNGRETVAVDLPADSSPNCEAAEWGSCPVDCSQGVTLSFVLDNDPALIPGVIERLRDVASRLRLFDEAGANRVGLALHEAILNGMYHGNLELDSALRQDDEDAYRQLAMIRRGLPPYCHRRLHVDARFDPNEAIFVVRDEGRGFDPGRTPDPVKDPACLERPSGRGLLLIRAFMDRVGFNSTGNSITLIKSSVRPGADPA